MVDMKPESIHVQNEPPMAKAGHQAQDARGPVEKALDDLDQEITQLDQEAARLIGKIYPSLRPMFEVSKEEAIQNDETRQSDLFMRLKESTRRIFWIREQLETSYDRCEL